MYPCACPGYIGTTHGMYGPPLGVYTPVYGYYVPGNTTTIGTGLCPNCGFGPGMCVCSGAYGVYRPPTSF
jgi:hypothetical protein